MAGKKTSIYLSESLAEQVEQSGLPIPELIRRGLAADAPDPIEVKLAELGDAIAGLEDTLGRTVTRAVGDAIDQRQHYG